MRGKKKITVGQLIDRRPSDQTPGESLGRGKGGVAERVAQKRKEEEREKEWRRKWSSIIVEGGEKRCEDVSLKEEVVLRQRRKVGDGVIRTKKKKKKNKKKNPDLWAPERMSEVFRDG